MKIYLAHSSAFNFKSKLYEPLRDSSLNQVHELLFPQEGPFEEISRDMIKTADALIAEVSMPSLGVGIEMGWADTFSLPVIAISEKGSRVSFSIDNVVTEQIEYENQNDMLRQLETVLTKLQS